MMDLFFAKLVAQLYVYCKVRQEQPPGREAESLAKCFCKTVINKTGTIN